MKSPLISPRAPLPTSFSQAVGARIRLAREEHGLSQIELAQRIERRQASISDMERGVMEPETTTLVLLAQELEKPLSYFFPAPFGTYEESDLTEDEQIIVAAFRRLPSEEYQQIAITLVTALGRQRCRP